MKKLSTKGMADNTIVNSMIIMLVVGVVGLIGITVFNSINSSLIGDLTSGSAADYAADNFTDGFYEGMDLSSNIPIVLAAGLLLMVIIGFAMYVRG
jgi:hypothetical protein